MLGMSPRLENDSWPRGSFHEQPLFRFPFPAAFNEKASLVSRLARLSKILDFGAPTTRRRRWTRSSGNKLQAPLARQRGFLFASRSFPPSIFYFAFLFLSCSLPSLSDYTAYTRIRSLYTRGNAVSRDAWPWTSRGFFGLSRTETGRNHADRVTLPCDFLPPHLGKSDRANSKGVLW